MRVAKPLEPGSVRLAIWRQNPLHSRTLQETRSRIGSLRYPPVQGMAHSVLLRSAVHELTWRAIVGGRTWVVAFGALAACAEDAGEPMRARDAGATLEDGAGGAVAGSGGSAARGGIAGSSAASGAGGVGAWAGAFGSSGGSTVDAGLDAPLLGDSAPGGDGSVGIDGAGWYVCGASDQCDLSVDECCCGQGGCDCHPAGPVQPRSCYRCDGPEDCAGAVCCNGTCRPPGDCAEPPTCRSPAHCPEAAPYCCTFQHVVGACYDTATPFPDQAITCRRE